MITIELKGDTELVAKYVNASARLRAGINARMVQLVALLETRIKQKLSGEVLKVQTGRLRASIVSQITGGASQVQGTVQSVGVPYAAIHEFGGKTRPHVILPVHALALRFNIGGKTVFAKSVNHPGSTMPERSYARSSLEELRETIVYSLYAEAFAALDMGAPAPLALAAE